MLPNSVRGLGAWTTPTPKQLQYLQTALVGILQKVLRVDQQFVSPDQILVKAANDDVRARMTVDRLLYAQRLYRTGPKFSSAPTPEGV